MRVAIYARVSSESQEARGTIGSQLEVPRRIRRNRRKRDRQPSLTRWAFPTPMAG